MSDLVPAASELANVSAAASNSGGAEPWWPRGWWKIMDTRIGIIPIPVFVILFALLVGFTYTGDIKGEVSMMIAVLVVGGFTCAEIGKRIPVLRNIGSAAIFATFIPSALAYYMRWLSPSRWWMWRKWYTSRKASAVTFQLHGTTSLRRRHRAQRRALQLGELLGDRRQPLQQRRRVEVLVDEDPAVPGLAPQPLQAADRPCRARRSRARRARRSGCPSVMS